MIHLPTGSGCVTRALAAALVLTTASMPSSAQRAAHAASSRDQFGLLHSELSNEFRGEVGVECNPCQLEDALDKRYARLALGHFDLRYPIAEFEDDSEFQHFVDIANALVELELQWIAWFEADGPQATEARKLAKDVKKWIAGWKPRGVHDALEKGTLDLAVIFEPKQKTRERVQRFDELTCSGAALGLPASESLERIQLVFAPDRAQLVGLACFVGEIDERNRGSYWHDGLIWWTDFWWNDVQFIGLEYPPVGATPQSWSPGTPMDGREKTGLLEHVVQRASFALTIELFGEELDPAIQGGLAQNAVIAMYQQNNTRSGGSTKGNTTRARSVFVPGGNPDGGFLPPNNADSRWRDMLGEDHFIHALTLAQTAGEQRGEDPLAGFQVISDNGGSRVTVRAPFLGAIAGKQMPDEVFHSDYREFFRAYKSGFVFWLQAECFSSEKKARATFAELISRAASDPASDFDALVVELYGVPISGASKDVDSLEWRFLKWLSKR